MNRWKSTLDATFISLFHQGTLADLPSHVVGKSTRIWTLIQSRTAMKPYIAVVSEKLVMVSCLGRTAELKLLYLHVLLLEFLYKMSMLPLSLVTYMY